MWWKFRNISSITNRTITKNFRLGKKGKRKIQIGINFTIEIGMEDRVFTRGRTVIDSVTDQRNSSANWEGKILPAWKTHARCVCTDCYSTWLVYSGRSYVPSHYLSRENCFTNAHLVTGIFLISAISSSPRPIPPNRNAGRTSRSRRFQTHIPVYFSSVNLARAVAAQRLN